MSNTLYSNLLIEYIKLNTLSDKIFDKYSDKNLRKLSIEELESTAVNLNKGFPNQTQSTAIDAINRILNNSNINCTNELLEIETFLDLLNIKYKIQ